MWVTFSPAWAESLVGTVISVADGDTVVLQTLDAERHSIRLAGIDAPEKNQPYGRESAAHLSEMVLGKGATIEFNKRDRYGRLVGKVLINGIDANLAQVRAGLAWHYKDYQSEQSVVDRARYMTAEISARAASRGLWRDASPTPPWDWRKRGAASNVPVTPVTPATPVN